MKELFAMLPHISPAEAHGQLLLDTCFIIYMLEEQQEKALLKHDCAILSFTAEELSFVEQHKIHDKSKVRLRHLLKQEHHLKIIDVDVHPGNPDQERSFVRSIEPGLLENIEDPSDAVLIAAAIRTQSNVLTRDKHHLYTSRLENFLNRYGIEVMNRFPDG
ncbi:MAG: PIN domain-containing protein [DPANN group archaeon]|nr:PIN domain-containing protein [DPANN group archaeon]